jgi:hypothetical protein
VAHEEEGFHRSNCCRSLSGLSSTAADLLELRFVAEAITPSTTLSAIHDEALTKH